MCLSIIILSSLTISSCKKNNVLIEKPDSVINVSTNSTSNFVQQGRSSSDLTSTQIPETLKEVFLKDSSILINIIQTGNPELSQTYITKLTNDISDYFLFRENIDIRAEFPNDPNGIILSGLFLATRTNVPLIPVDRQGTSQEITINRVDDLSCFMTAIGALIGISDARNIWASIQAGASSETVIGTIKLIGRRVASVITVVFTVYQVGECLDWW